MATGFRNTPLIGTVKTIEGIECGLETSTGALLLQDTTSGVRSRVVFPATYGKGTVETVDGLTVEEYGNGIYRKTVFTFESMSMTMTDAGSAQSSGSQKLYTFPAGSILVHGAVANLTLLKSGSGISATFNGDFAVGTAAAAADATLSSTEQNIIPTTATPAATAGATTAKGRNTAAIAPLDSTTTGAAPKAIYLNQLVDDADSSASAAILYSGAIVVHWTNLGDN